MAFTNPAAAQVTKASLTAQLRHDSAEIYRFRKVQSLLALDSRNTFAQTPRSNNTPFELRGIKAGVVLHERHKLALGLYTIRESKAKIRPDDNGPVREVNLRLLYIGASYEYLFIDNRWWQLGIPIEAGIGGYDAPKPDSNVTLERLRIFPLGSALDVHFKPLRWLSLTAMGGYRYVATLKKGPVNLNNWFYAYGVSLNTKNIWDDTKYFLKKRKYKKAIAKLPG